MIRGHDADAHEPYLMFDLTPSLLERPPAAAHLFGLVVTDEDVGH